MTGGVLANETVKGFQHLIADRKIRALRRVIVFNLLDAIRFEPGDRARGKLADKIKCCFNYPAARRVGSSRARLDVRRNAGAATSDASGSRPLGGSLRRPRRCGLP